MRRPARSRADWLGAVEANLLPPVELIKTYVPAMRQRNFGRIVNITCTMVKSPSATWVCPPLSARA